MSLSDLRALLVRASIDWDLRWTRDQIIGLLRGTEKPVLNHSESRCSELVTEPEEQSKRRYRLEMLGDFGHLTFLHASINKKVICTRERPWCNVSLDGSEMLRIELSPPSGFMVLPVSVLMGKVFPKRRMTYWERSTGHVAGTIELGISCQEYEETEIKPGAAALQLLDEVPGRGRIESEEANEEDGRSSGHLTELKKEIAALEELNAQLRSRIAGLMNDSEEGQENHQQE
ncbi:hypothetical protein FOL46_008130 [Perkinsus olseni]|uniref:Uncharacterized protein n=2 Tax=Perkinsus olseni TaxID=32597 RepID=A0A7J6L977_PEROL|nr:hypothetical protein FOL46_008130 [Perkinsus olseni]